MDSSREQSDDLPKDCNGINHDAKDESAVSCHSSAEELQSGSTRAPKSAFSQGVDLRRLSYSGRFCQPEGHSPSAKASPSFSALSDECVVDRGVQSKSRERSGSIIKQSKTTVFTKKRNDEERDSTTGSISSAHVKNAASSSGLQTHSGGKSTDQVDLEYSDDSGIARPKDPPRSLLPYRQSGSSPISLSQKRGCLSEKKEFQSKGGCIKSYQGVDDNVAGVGMAATDTEDARTDQNKISKGTQREEPLADKAPLVVRDTAQSGTPPDESVLESFALDALTCYSPRFQQHAFADRLSPCSTGSSTILSNDPREVGRNLMDEAETAFRLSRASATGKASDEDTPTFGSDLDPQSPVSRSPHNGNEILNIIPEDACQIACQMIGTTSAERTAKGNNSIPLQSLKVDYDLQRRSTASQERASGKGLDDVSLETDEMQQYQPSVTFQSPVVTSLRNRPRTSPAEIKSLYYIEEELQQMQLDASCDDAEDESLKTTASF